MTCAACGKVRASKEARENLDEACYDHEACGACAGWCWYAHDSACAEAHGGWGFYLARQREEWVRAFHALTQRLTTVDDRLYFAARERDMLLAENEELRRRLEGGSA